MKKQLSINHREARQIFLAGIFLSGLVSCISYPEADFSSEGVAQGFASRTLHDDGLQRFLADYGAAKGPWTVDRLALAAVYFRGSIAVARATAEEAAAKVTTAGQIPNPVLTFTPGYNTSTMGISPWVINPQIKFIIETAGKRQLRVEKSRAMVEAAQLRVSAAAWLVWKEVRAPMLECYAAEQTANILKNTGNLRQQEIKLLQAQVDAGESSAFQLTLAREALSQARLDLQNAEKRRAIAISQLATAVGIPPAALREVELNFSAFRKLPEFPGEKARSAALIYRADLLAALADYRAMDADLRLELAKQYPDIALYPAYSFSQGENKWQLGLRVMLPVFNQNQGLIAEATARRKKSAKIFETLQIAVFGEIETALAGLRTSTAKVDIAARQTAEANRASAMTAQMVEAGELIRLDLIRRRIAANISELALATARIEAQSAAGALESAVQTPYHNTK